MAKENLGAARRQLRLHRPKTVVDMDLSDWSSNSGAPANLQVHKFVDRPLGRLRSNSHYESQHNSPSPMLSTQVSLDDVENVSPQDRNAALRAQQHPQKARPAKLSIKELESTEPILMDNPNRFVLFPIKYNEVS